MMSYYNRLQQLGNTLISIGNSRHRDFEIVIVDDASDEPLAPEPIKFNNTHIIPISKEEKNWYNPMIPYNRGIEKALTLNPDVIIIQNPECAHYGDILRYVSENLTDENYISFPCFSLGKEDGWWEIPTVILKNYRAAETGGCGWYNHSVHRPNGFDFCSAITTKNLIKLNGFDERFADGVACGDNDFRNRIDLLGLKVEIPDYPIAIHQWHYDGYDPYSRDDLYQKNKELLKVTEAEKNYRAVHTKTRNFDE